MTALVGVLNKRGAAIAANSAMTVFGNGNSKIYNNEQKIFPLSDRNPVGVMICNNLNFLTTPWALIFELYKEKRGGMTFPSLTDYVNDFIEFAEQGFTECTYNEHGSPDLPNRKMTISE